MPKPTMDDVAREAGVSRALVSLVMRNSDKVSDRSRAAVLEAASTLGYRPNLSARHLASKRTRTFGMVINDLHNPYFAGVADGVKAAADETGYRLLLNSAFLSDDDERSALETFIDFNVDGIILSGARVSKSVIEQTAESVPVVVASDPVKSRKVDTINNDDHAGATLVVEHLVELGHRRIVHIDGGSGAGAKQRKAGYTETMERHGLVPNVVPGVFTEASGVDAAEMALKQDPSFTAVFAGNDMSALGALDALDAAGLRVPDDVSLVGYDNTFIAALRHIGLTTIDQGRDRIGRLAVEMLIERVEDGRTTARHLTTPPTLVVRNTTASPRD
ncbi:LacI family DNA-binding transcriptional regulator [Ilumatobacter sp.]|uniref:LacI family DNA-binding transcriptional regulator n=1 Tax=Ilumatobacter sp. TaxID=1967498 RepID=UPI003AF8E289